MSPPPLLGATVNGVPPQVAAVVLAILGIGLTVTVTVNDEPAQLEDGIVSVLIAITLIGVPGLSLGRLSAQI